jgi:hypothetical protein
VTARRSMDEARFRQYIAAFNGARYDLMGEYFADDVTLSFPDGNTLYGLEGIAAFYRPIHSELQEILEIDFLLIGERAIAIELYTEFHAKQDTERAPGGPLRAGEVVRFTSFVHYELDDSDRFRRIRVARYRAHDEHYRAQHEHPDR